MSSNHGSERLARGLAAIDDAMCDEIDARVARRLAAGERPDPANFRDDGPDPLGTGFAWAGEVSTRADSPPATPATPASGQPGRSRSRRYIAFGGAVLAASLLIAVGVILGRAGPGGGREVAFAARVAAREDVARGPGTVAEITVDNQADQKAFLTIVGLTANRRPPVHYREEQRFIDVPARGSQTVKNLPASFDGCPAALVVLTATPAGEVVRGLLADPAAPETAEAVRDRLMAALTDVGYRGAAVEVVRLGQAGR